MKIVADENIPLVEHYFGGSGELLLKPGRSITRDDLFDADILLVRSVTRVNKLLLHDTPVRFVGSTTAGADHMDTEWLDQSGILWNTATACNAMAVAEYVVCVVASLQMQGMLAFSNVRAGVIGVGHVGRLVVEKLRLLGFDAIECDPFRS
jgi:erythronate-4-phosphate dehydrogenase